MESAQSKIVGVLGGGQLGRMMVEAAHPLQFKLKILDPQKNSSASFVCQADQLVLGDFNDESAVVSFAETVDILTYEIEHVNVAGVKKALALAQAAQRPFEVHPHPETVEIIQDKFRQKSFLRERTAPGDVPILPFVEVTSLAQLKKVCREELGYPAMLKSKKLAYDGRGNAVIPNEEAVEKAIEALGYRSDQLHEGQLYLEKWVQFDKELAVMVAKGKRPIDMVSYPVVETIQRDHVCRLVYAPASIPAEVQQRAKRIAEKAAAAFEGAGLFGVELFMMADGSLYLNELAPRPHNSGHYTIEACEVSQFEMHLRAVLGLPLVGSHLKVGAAVMLNILGQEAGDTGLRSAMDLCSKALSIDGASVHWYGKEGCRPGRKLGHITVVGVDLEHTQKAVAPLLELDSKGSTHQTDSAASPLHASGKTSSKKPLVGVIMGSDSDLKVMEDCARTLRDFKVPFELTIVSAHRTPDRMLQYARSAHERGLRVIIAAAGGAAHLPGMVAALTPLPVIGVPIALKHLDGVDSLHSIVQMPRGVPVATVAINNSTNAALLAIRILGAHDARYLERMMHYQQDMEASVMHKIERLETLGWESYHHS